MHFINNKKRNIANLSIAIAALLFIIVGLYFVVRNQLDSDMASDMILGKLLSTSDELILSNNWVYSTEIRILSIQVLFSIFFHFTNNWFVVRFLTIIVLLFILCVLIYKICKQLKIVDYGLTIAITLLPISYCQLRFEYINLLYIVYFIYMLVIINLFLVYYYTNKTIYLLLSFLFSTIFCLEGSRFLLIIYFPIIVSSFFVCLVNKKVFKNILLFISTSFAGAIIGYFINKYYLLNIYIVPGNINIEFSIDFAKSIVFLKGYLCNFGYSHTYFSTFFSIFSIVLLWFCITKVLIRNRHNVLLIFFVIFYLTCIIGLFICFVFTNVPFEERYIMTINSFSFILIAYCVSIFENERNDIILPVLFIGCMICSMFIFMDAKSNNKTQELDYIATNLVEKGYYNGYSFFWTSNILTELSNGKIEVWDWGESSSTELKSDFKNIDEMYWWLQKLDHMKNTPKGKIFVLLQRHELEKFLDLTWNFTSDDVLFETEQCVVYGFESYNDLKNKVGY